MQPSSSPAIGNYENYLSLTDKELTEVKMGASDPVSTVTWLDSSLDESLLMERLNRMVSLNPWLTGRFLTRNKTIEMGYNHQPSKEEIGQLVEVLEIPELTKYGVGAGASFGTLMKIVKEHILKKGGELKGDPLFKLVLAKPNTFVMSMSHGLGDGSSYYTMYNMLISGKIEKVDVERIFNLADEKEQVMGGYPESHLVDNWGMIVMFVRGLLFSALIASWFPFAERATCRFFTVCSESIQDIKKKTPKNEVSYVSTNDIVTSWFFQNSGFKHAFMAVNLRGRMKEAKLTKNRIGNYEDLIYYRKLDFETPERIRQSMSLPLRRAVTSDQPISAWSLALSEAAIISNWSSFCNLGSAEGFQILHHAPVSDIEYSVPATTAVCIVFEASPGKLGVQLLGTPSKLKGMIDSVPFEDKQAGIFLSP